MIVLKEKGFELEIKRLLLKNVVKMASFKPMASSHFNPKIIPRETRMNISLE